MQKTPNLQDLFLLRARRTHANVTTFLMNGYQLKGQIVKQIRCAIILCIKLTS